MATVAEFSIPSSSFPLGQLLSTYPDVTLELERIVPINESVIPYLWLRGARPSDDDWIVASAREHPDILNVEIIDEVEGQYLLRLEWVADTHGVLRGIAATDVTLLSGVGSGEELTIEIQSETRDGISAFQQYCTDHGISIELVSLHALSALRPGGAFGLTDAQREALLLAYERGYYHSPREVTLEELAAEVDITGQSFGSRLRRGIHRLIGNTLASPAD